MKQTSKTTRKRGRKRTITAEASLQVLENERRYVARELHDGVAQTTLQLGLQAGICRKLLERGNLETLANELAALESRIQLASIQVREIIADMRPPQLEPDASLKEYLQFASDTNWERTGPPLQFQVNMPDQSSQLSPAQKLTLTRIAQEALLNIRKHAQAQNIRLCLTDDADNFYLIVADNGQGFDPAEVEARPVDQGGAGLANMQARAEALGGTLAITRDANGEWTEVKVTIPKT
ncbi:MAG: sensor histidine kinase [Chloroflexi bacterium]|nr:sensor histidine kinase [Chloroflexota bacterium]